jgi:hypothetical protein
MTIEKSFELNMFSNITAVSEKSSFAGERTRLKFKKVNRCNGDKHQVILKADMWTSDLIQCKSIICEVQENE